MLEKIPAVIGEALSGIRPGEEATLWEDEAIAHVPATMRLTSPAFEDEGHIPQRYTADGQKLSPALTWFDVPQGAAELVLVVEDADPPAPRPLVHVIVRGLPPQDGGIGEDAMSSEHPAVELGRNSYLQSGWLAPDPPTGHGEHRYVFQIYALAAPTELGDNPGRGAVRDAIAAHGIARGRLIGTYARQ